MRTFRTSAVVARVLRPRGRARPVAGCGAVAGDRGSGRAAARRATAVYAWYARNAALTACVLRDAEHHALDAGDHRAALRPADGSLARGARRRAERRQRALLELALELLHLAEPDARGRTEAGCRRGRDGSGHRVRALSSDAISCFGPGKLARSVGSSGQAVASPLRAPAATWLANAQRRLRITA